MRNRPCPPPVLLSMNGRETSENSEGAGRRVGPYGALERDSNQVGGEEKVEAGKRKLFQGKGDDRVGEGNFVCLICYSMI